MKLKQLLLAGGLVLALGAAPAMAGDCRPARHHSSHYSHDYGHRRGHSYGHRDSRSYGHRARSHRAPRYYQRSHRISIPLPPLPHHIIRRHMSRHFGRH